MFVLVLKPDDRMMGPIKNLIDCMMKTFLGFLDHVLIVLTKWDDTSFGPYKGFYRDVKA